MFVRKFCIVSALGLWGLAAVARENAIAKWDARMAVENAVVTGGVKWIDGKYLPIEGRAFSNTAGYYERLPVTVTTNVNGGVRGMKNHTTGMMFRFRTDSKNLHFKWTNSGRAMDHMPATGVSGIDIYRFDERLGEWRFVKTGRVSGNRSAVSIGWKAGSACLVNLPLYNGIEKFTLGIDEKATITGLGPRKSGIDKPVVFYGTSITHGGCCSRPGLSFVNIVGRELDVPVVNLGFSGSGKMELEMSEHLAAIDASCYVLDCLWNMSPQEVRERYEPFVRNLRAKRPGVPIVFAEQCDVFMGPQDPKDRHIMSLFSKLQAEGWKNVVYLPKTALYSGDGEGTVDGCHPNDRGMLELAAGFGKAVRIALGLGR